MRYCVLFVICSLSLTSCLEDRKSSEKQTPKIIDNLPVNDRDLLLAPLEQAMDDLRASIDADESYFHSESEGSNEQESWRKAYKLDGPDTVWLKMEIHNDHRDEAHQWFYDKGGKLFFSEHKISDKNSLERRAYKFYFEENGSLVSSYGKTAFGVKVLPEVWTPICLTNEEEAYLQSRKSYAR